MFRLSVIFAPVLCVGLLSVVLVSGTPGVHVAQPLHFSRFIALPPSPLEFKAFWGQNRSLAQVRRTCTLQTSAFRTNTQTNQRNDKTLKQ